MSSWTSTSPSMERWLKITTTKIMTIKTMKMMTMMIFLMIKQGWWWWWWWRVPEHQPPYPWRGGHLQILKTTSLTTMMMTKKIMITLLSRTMMTKMIMANINDAIDDNTTAIAGVGPLCWWQQRNDLCDNPGQGLCHRLWKHSLSFLMIISIVGRGWFFLAAPPHKWLITELLN